jgi:excisionase family DNA binding protein
VIDKHGDTTVPNPNTPANAYLAAIGSQLQSDLLTREEASAYLRIPLGTLDNWRSTRIVRVPFYKVGGRVFYKRKDLDAFLQECRVA